LTAANFSWLASKLASSYSIDSSLNNPGPDITLEMTSEGVKPRLIGLNYTKHQPADPLVDTDQKDWVLSTSELLIPPLMYKYREGHSGVPRIGVVSTIVSTIVSSGGGGPSFTIPCDHMLVIPEFYDDDSALTIHHKRHGLLIINGTEFNLLGLGLPDLSSYLTELERTKAGADPEGISEVVNEYISRVIIDVTNLERYESLGEELVNLPAGTTDRIRAEQLKQAAKGYGDQLLRGASDSLNLNPRKYMYERARRLFFALEEILSNLGHVLAPIGDDDFLGGNADQSAVMALLYYIGQTEKRAKLRSDLELLHRSATSGRTRETETQNRTSHVLSKLPGVIYTEIRRGDAGQSAKRGVWVKLAGGVMGFIMPQVKRKREIDPAQENLSLGNLLNATFPNPNGDQTGDDGELPSDWRRKKIN